VLTGHTGECKPTALLIEERRLRAMADTAAGAPGETSQGVREFTCPDYIGWGWMIIQTRMEADWKGIWNYAIPHLHASDETMARTEAQLGFRLPESY